MEVKIDVQLFDEIEAYLQARAGAKDSEAARLLMCLEGDAIKFIDTPIQSTSTS